MIAFSPRILIVPFSGTTPELEVAEVSLFGTPAQKPRRVSNQSLHRGAQFEFMCFVVYFYRVLHFFGIFVFQFLTSISSLHSDFPPGFWHRIFPQVELFSGRSTPQDIDDQVHQLDARQGPDTFLKEEKCYRWAKK